MTATWTRVCEIEAIVADTGVCARIGDTQVAVFKLADDSVHAIGNVDPFSGASVLSRGIVGDIGGVPVVASPIFKNAFRLRDGTSVDDPSHRVPSYAATVRDGDLLVSVTPRDQ